MNIMDIYGLTQLVTEPTSSRVAKYTRTLMDLCLTNSPYEITNSGVIELASAIIVPFF